MIMINDESKTKKGQGIPAFQVIENECIWMKAGVVNFRLCDKHYDCFHCSFDQGMRRALNAQKPAKGNGANLNWAKDMRKKYQGAFKPCRYFLTGQIGPPGQCFRDYDCDGCPIDMELEYEPLMKRVEVDRYAQELNRSGGARTLSYEETGEEEQCVWMKAGIINFRLCDQKYDCSHCEFDQSMRLAMAPEAGSEAEEEARLWVKQMNETYETVSSPCIHALAGQGEAPMQCEQNYECYRCEVHQALSQSKKVPAVSKPKYRLASGFRVADGYYYHFGHTWVHPEAEGHVRVGVDDFVGKVFGKAKRIELPPVGNVIQQGDMGWVMAHNGHRAAIRAPLTGRVLALNQKAVQSPEISHKDPYQKGWLFILEPSSLQHELQGLYFGEEGFHWMEKETRSLLNLLGPDYERLAATGGQLVDDLFGHFPGIGWNRLVRNFVHTGKRA